MSATTLLRSAPARTVFDLKLRAIGFEHGRRRLVNAHLTCAPPHDCDQHEYHWLAYVNSAADDADNFSTACDLWRWHRSSWRSISAPGASFTAEEMFDQGWRYCGPNVEPVARVVVD